MTGKGHIPGVNKALNKGFAVARTGLKAVTARLTLVTSQ